MPSGRPSGGKNKCWTKEEKEKIVLYHLNNSIGMDKCAKHFGISRCQMFKWVTRYREYGIEGLENKKKPGNPLAKYSNKKKLTKEEIESNTTRLAETMNNLHTQLVQKYSKAID